MTIDYKTVGMLVDEWITALLKQRANPSDENTQRVADLNRRLNERVGERGTEIIPLIERLKEVLKACWDAQEITFSYAFDRVDDMDRSDLNRLAQAGKDAQTTNAERNRIIREIDRVLGEGQFTPLEKTYE